jgi:glycosyltransferase involved in cell wall biosynthesis
VSPSLAAEVRRLPGVPNPRVTVVGHGSSNGVDTRRFTPPSPEDRDRSRAAVGAGPDDVVLGFVGRLREDKGLRELMAAWQELREIPRAKLVVVGDLEDAPSAAAAEVAESGLHITGFVQDSAPWYAALDVLVLPTYREGFPNVVLEAAACGLPAVTTNATGARDSVVDGVTGLVVPVGDARALASALRRLVDDGGLRQQLGRAARERVVDHFDQQTVWSAYRQIWTDGTPEAQERTRPGV